MGTARAAAAARVRVAKGAAREPGALSLPVGDTYRELTLPGWEKEESRVSRSEAWTSAAAAKVLVKGAKASAAMPASPGVKLHR